MANRLCRYPGAQAGRMTRFALCVALLLAVLWGAILALVLRRLF